MAISEYTSFKATLKQLFKELDPTLDMRDGLAIPDLLLEPSALLLKNFYQRLVTLEEKWSLDEYEELTTEQMDRLANNFALERLSGAKVRGRIRIYFTSPTVTIYIPQGTIFSTAGGLNYSTIQDYEFTATELLSHTDVVGYYCEIVVEATEEGSEYAISAGEIISTSTDTGIDYLRMINPEDFWGGAPEETNEELYERIQNSITARNFMTNNGIKLILSELFDSTQDITIIGQGEMEMERDKVYDIGKYPLTEYPYGPILIRDFKGKIKASPDLNPHVASMSVSTNLKDDIDIFVDEISQDAYLEISWADYDPYVFTTGRILNETFDDEIIWRDNYVKGEEGLKWGIESYPEISRIEGGVLIMGIAKEDMDIDTVYPRAFPIALGRTAKSVAIDLERAIKGVSII